MPHDIIDNRELHLADAVRPLLSESVRAHFAVGYFFDLKGPICNLQTPNIRQGVRSRYDHITWEFHDGEECRDMTVKVINDDQGRMLVLAVHNCDNGDGWKREARKLTS